MKSLEELTNTDDPAIDLIRLGHTDLFRWALTNKLAQFYEDLRWTAWFKPPVGFIGKSATNISANDLIWEFFQKGAGCIPPAT